MKLAERIEINPEVMVGKPVIKGTRVPVALLLKKLSEGSSTAELLEAYPHLVKEDIYAALAYAAAAVSLDETVLLKKPA